MTSYGDREELQRCGLLSCSASYHVEEQGDKIAQKLVWHLCLWFNIDAFWPLS